jgi:hypothetical protein
MKDRQSPTTSAEVKIMWIYRSPPPILLHDSAELDEDMGRFTPMKEISDEAMMLLFEEWCLLGCYAVWLL